MGNEEYLGVDAFKGSKKVGELQALRLQIQELNMQLAEMSDKNKQLEDNLRVNK